MSFGGQSQLKLAKEVAEVSKLLPPPIRWDRGSVDLKHGAETVTTEEATDAFFRPRCRGNKPSPLRELPTDGIRPVAEQHGHKAIRLLQHHT